MIREVNSVDEQINTKYSDGVVNGFSKEKLE